MSLKHECYAPKKLVSGPVLGQSVFCLYLECQVEVFKAPLRELFAFASSGPDFRGELFEPVEPPRGDGHLGAAGGERPGKASAQAG